MKARLIIKNFGPITDLDIEIKKYNILIGPQASGKSTIAKLLCVIHDFFKQEKNNQNIEDKSSSDKNPIILFVKLLRNYKIEGYFYEGTYLSFEDSFLKITIDNNGIINTNVHLLALSLMTYYIPAERIALPMITESLFELTSEQSTLPQFFLNFGREFTLARGRHDNDKILPGFDLNFEFRNGKNYIKLESGESILLDVASSSMQANIPLILILSKLHKLSRVIAIEELGLHCFPILQKKLLNFVIEQTSRLPSSYVVLPTHSPYILSAANNLLFANKVGSQSEESRLETNKIINETSWIDKDDFAAYYLDNGTAKSIGNEQTGLIDENELDGISEDLGEEFDLLMDLYKPAHA